MPDTDLFLDPEDERSLVSFILEQQGRLVADRQRSASYETIESCEAYEAARQGGGGKWALENERLFFLLYESYQECPLELRRVDGGYYAGTYYVSPRTGGPTIQFLASTITDKLGIDYISDGFLGYYPTYESTITGKMERTPKTLVDQYKAIVERLRYGAVTIRAHTGRKYVIGPHTYTAVKSGELKLGVKGLELPSDYNRPANFDYHE